MSGSAVLWDRVTVLIKNPIYHIIAHYAGVGKQ